MCDLILLPIVLLHLVLEQLHACAHERLVVARVVLEPALGHVDDVCTHAVQEILRVRDQHQNAFVAVHKHGTDNQLALTRVINKISADFLI